MSPRPCDPRRRPLLCAGLYALLLVAGAALAAQAELLSDVRALVGGERLGAPMLTAILLLYAVLLACPFVPGAEIGLLLLMGFGAEMALPVYLATVAGLTLAFSIGRTASGPVLSRTPGRFHPARLAARLNAWPDAWPGAWPDEPGRVGTDRSPPFWLRTLLKRRAAALIVLFNTPGNAILGGGGGIAMAAGMSRLFPFRTFLASTAIAVAPVPLAVLLAAQFDGNALCGLALRAAP
ncbi:MAG: hypothetical protein NXI21_00115 [Alphaproteobacteria bacterium]|nr:hypothetical protein [Alphaproteobacteria bacterium]